MLQKGIYEDVKNEYEINLFRKNKPSTFKDVEGVMFSGFIKSVSDIGYLQVLLEDNILKEYSKERERYYINHYDCVNINKLNGYNKVKKKEYILKKEARRSASFLILITSQSRSS